MCGLQSFASRQSSAQSSPNTGLRSWAACRLGSIITSVGNIAGRSKNVGIACLAVLAVALAGTPAFADPVDYTLPASYTLGVTVATIFPIAVAVLSGVLMPMIVFSLCLATVYFLWSFVKGKAFGGA